MSIERIIVNLTAGATQLRQAMAALASAIEQLNNPANKVILFSIDCPGGEVGGGFDLAASSFADLDSCLISEANSGGFLHDNRNPEFAERQLRASWFVVDKTPIRERQINLHQHQQPQLCRRMGFPRSGYLPRRIRRIRKSR